MLFGRASRSRRAAEREAERWLEFTGPVRSRRRLLPAALNLHQRKFLELARALAAGPRLDHARRGALGLASSEMAAATELVLRIRDQGRPSCSCEHIMRAVMALADRVVVLMLAR